MPLGNMGFEPSSVGAGVPPNSSRRMSSSRRASDHQLSTPEEYPNDDTKIDDSMETSEESAIYVYEGQNVTELPPSVVETIYMRPDLRKLSLQGNQLSVLPSVIGQLSELYYLNLSNNHFTDIPSCIAKLKSLEILDISNNRIEDLPALLKGLPNLMGLSLVNNNIKELPTVIADLPKLAILELDENPFQLPDYLEPSEYDDDETWLAALQSYVRKHNSKSADSPIISRERPLRTSNETVSSATLPSTQASGSVQSSDNAQISGVAQLGESALSPVGAQSTSENWPVERMRSSSESGASISLRASKRMGFVMSRNATDKSYVASLHARGTSFDSHLNDSSSAGSSLNGITLPPILNTGSASMSPTLDDGSVHLRSLSNAAPTTNEPLDLSTPRSPLPRSPYGSPWGSPRPSFVEPEPQSSVSSRLSTLAEEHDPDGDTADTDWDSPSIDNSTQRAINGGVNTPGKSTADESRYFDAPVSLFKDVYQERHESSSAEPNTEPLDWIPPVSTNVMRHPSYPPVLYDKLREALREVGDFFQKQSSILPVQLASTLTEALNMFNHDNWPTTMTIYLDFMDKLVEPAIFQKVVHQLDRRDQRRLATSILYSFPELESAWRICQQSRLSPMSVENATLAWAHDEQLHSQLGNAIKQMQDVLSLLNNLISQSALTAADDPSQATGMASKVRELSTVCIRCSTATRDVKRQLDRKSPGKGRLLSNLDRRRFWDDVNTFLKAVVSILAAVKTSLTEIPLLSDKRVGFEVATLSRLAKEVPPLLEQSSYRVILETHNQNSAGDSVDLNDRGMSIVDLNNSGGLPPPTPLTATLGPAAQALVSPNERPSEGYIQYGLRANMMMDA